MANPDLISRLAWQRCIGDRFINYLGEEEIIPVARKERMLRTMGYDLDDDAAIEEAIFQLDGAPWTRLLRPVYVLTADTSGSVGPGVECHVPDALLDTTGEWRLALEEGLSELEGDWLPAELEETGEYWIGDQRYSRRLLPVPAALPLGYHQLTLALGAKSATASLILAPAQAYQSKTMAAGERIWGTAIQLYTLRSETNWGLGDFSDLNTLIQEMSARGAGFIGLNPIHALYPINPEHASPYSPSNRSFINPLYVDVTRVPEFEFAKALQKRYRSPEFQAELESLRADTHVDYARVGPLKYEFFEGLYTVFRARHLERDTDRGRQFRAFVEQGGEALFEHATFEALLAHFKAQDINAWGWPAWPESYQDHHSPAVQQFVDTHQDAIQYRLYLQFIADEQLRAVNAAAERSGMALGLYRDLAVGADRGGAEVWSNREIFCGEASVGAPPDALGPTGQNWGLPPLDPIRLEAEAYATFITLVRNNMRGCGALRIDHAMALFRLWWCPPGADAAQGVYVHYNLDHLLGILNLESQRNQCMVIAEDLGTVPEEVMHRFPAAQLYSNKVFYFETSPAGTTPPEQYPARSLAIVANHDMPTLSAYWNRSDLELRRTLNMFPTPDSYHEERARREGCKQSILDALQATGRLPAGVPERAEELPEMTPELSFAIHCFLASGSAQLVAVQLEDLLLINDPVNVPGTSDEYRNWRRKLTQDTRGLFRAEGTDGFAHQMTRERS
ncbi:4-alpha-glucanotransferase [Natronospirillum operosum]|uniref:4-alpha-glucanotransferase n=1 Tax=Natronospirillum operosum TaxID=2759953 RepID=A0A4Z0WFF3_9GAMM|nr:4-alpha-glucanotransferase [Natronospirillum operosum]TGG95348.1 4-alpha-glucanotransferase [Natronospirillum operosum]